MFVNLQAKKQIKLFGINKRNFSNQIDSSTLYYNDDNLFPWQPIFLLLTIYVTPLALQKKKELNKVAMAVFLKTHFLFFVLMFSCLLLSGSKSVFHIKDVLPMLPVQVSWPIVNSLYSAVDLLPSFVGAVSIANNNTLQWKGACFYNNTAFLDLHNKTGSRYGGGTIHIKVFFHKNIYLFFFLFVTLYV